MAMIEYFTERFGQKWAASYGFDDPASALVDVTRTMILYQRQ